jgi:competence protein ComEC
MRRKQVLILSSLGLVLILRILPAVLVSRHQISYPKEPNDLQKTLVKNFVSFLPSPEGELLSGIVLGSKDTLPNFLFNQLKQTGTLHITVASGMNISLLAGSVFGILAIFFKRKTGLIILLILIWFYAYITGFEPPIIRAAIMVSLVFLAQELGKPTDNLRILAMTGYVMVLLSPKLIYSLSFQLSFASTLGLILIQPIFKKSKIKVLRLEGLSSTLACQVATLPIVLANFGEYNLISILVNFLILWTVPIILQLGLGVAFLSLFLKLPAQLLAYLIYPPLKYFVMVVKIFSNLKMFQFWLPRFGFWAGVGYYLILIWLVYKIYKRPEPDET